MSANNDGPRLLAHPRPVAYTLSTLHLFNKAFSRGVITVRTILENAARCFKISLPLTEDLHLAAPVAGYFPVVVTSQVEVKLTDGVPHTLVNVKLDSHNEILGVVPVKDGEQYRLVIELE